jgi:hypothetical protein
MMERPPTKQYHLVKLKDKTGYKNVMRNGMGHSPVPLVFLV